MPFTCESCKRSFSNRFSFLQHTCPQTERAKVRTAQPSQMDEFRKYQRDDLKKHERTHTDEKQFKCHPCDKSFKDLEELDEHNKSHTCKFLMQNKCKFGSSGKNHNGVCSYAHPRLCIYFQTTGRCKKGDNCDFLHTGNVQSINSRSSATPRNRESHLSRQGKGPSMDMAFLGQSLLKLVQNHFQNQEQDSNNNSGFNPRRPSRPMNRR